MHNLNNCYWNAQTFAADIFFSQTWLDYRLRLPENMTASYRLLPTAWLQEMWRPDAFFKNAKKVTFQDITIPNHYIWLFQDKRILYMVKYVTGPYSFFCRPLTIMNLLKPNQFPKRIKNKRKKKRQSSKWFHSKRFWSAP